MSYSKLHSSLVGSSLWSEKDSVRILFITLLAMCDKDGIVYGSRPGIERIALIDPDEADEAWATLMAPDKHSSDRMRAPENEGRRIEEVPGGFRLLNFLYYRGLRNDDDRREQNRIAQARHKAKVSQGKPESAKVSQGKPQKAHTEAEADTEAVKTKARRRAISIDPSGLLPDFPDELAEVEGHIREWLRYKAEKNQGYKPTGVKQLWAALLKIGVDRIPAALSHSMSMNYSGVFEARANGAQASARGRGAATFADVPGEHV